METRTLIDGLLQFAGWTLRSLPPLGVLVLGFFAYTWFSVELDKEKKPEEEPKVIRTNVAELEVSDYAVKVTANGIVQPVNEVTMSAEVAGRIVQVSPKFEVGAYFQQGDLLLEVDDRDYQTALDVVESRELGAEAALELAKQQHERLSRLLASNNVSEAEVMQAESNRKQAAAALSTIQAEVEQAKRDLERTKVFAPFHGRLRSKLVGIGQSISTGTPLGIAFSVDLAEVRLPLSSRELPYLQLPEHEGDKPVGIELVNAIGDDSSRTVWKAEIVRTEGALDVNSLELFAIARIQDPFGLATGGEPLRIGQPVRASIPGQLLKNVVALPRSAVRQLDQVYLVDDKELTLSTKTIQPIWSDEQHVVIRDVSLADGNWLSTTQLVYAPEGAKVEIVPDIELAGSDRSDEAAKTN